MPPGVFDVILRVVDPIAVYRACYRLNKYYHRLCRSNAAIFRFDVWSDFFGSCRTEYAGFLHIEMNLHDRTFLRGDFGFCPTYFQPALVRVYFVTRSGQSRRIGAFRRDPAYDKLRSAYDRGIVKVFQPAYQLIFYFSLEPIGTLLLDMDLSDYDPNVFKQ